jgi:hypothetical protein
MDRLESQGGNSVAPVTGFDLEMLLAIVAAQLAYLLAVSEMLGHTIELLRRCCQGSRAHAPRRQIDLSSTPWPERERERGMNSGLF